MKQFTKEDYTITNARDHNTDLELLTWILKQNNNDWVSQNAANNPNCPLKEKIQWMRATGQIGTEDPNKHFIEYDSKEDHQENDQDLNTLKQLIQ